MDEEDVMPKGGVRAPNASFSRKTSLDNSVICEGIHTSGLVFRSSEQLLGSDLLNPHLPVLLLDQALGFLHVLVKLLNVAGLGLQLSELLLHSGQLRLGHLPLTLVE